MSEELVKVQSHAIVLSSEEKEVIRDVYCKDATDAEMAVFLQTCQVRGFDPRAGQIHMVKRYDPDTGGQKMTIQTGIDGYRLTAQRSKEYNGQDGPFWCGADGVWKEEWLSKEQPAAAKVLVYRKGIDRPFVGMARFDAYVQTKKGGGANSRWTKAGPEQMAKCAEALALRRAFPEELSGIYTDTEMEHLDSEEKPSKASEIRDAVKKAREGKIQDAVVEEVIDPTPEEKNEILVSAFHKAYGIEEPQLAEYLGRSRDQWTDEDRATLKGVYDKYKNDRAGIGTVFGTNEPEPDPQVEEEIKDIFK